MNRTKAAELAEIMKRYANGEVVQWQREGCPQNTWYHFPEPPFDHSKYIFRVLDFPEPPKGKEWWNPMKLTATNVGVHEGWRLLLEGELRGTYYRVWDYTNRKWDEGLNPWQKSNEGSFYTFRTKAPLPKPDPTPEELEEAEMRKASKSLGYIEDSFEPFVNGWKAHAAYLKTLEVVK